MRNDEPGHDLSGGDGPPAGETGLEHGASGGEPEADTDDDKGDDE